MQLLEAERQRDEALALLTDCEEEAGFPADFGPRLNAILAKRRGHP